MKIFFLVVSFLCIIHPAFALTGEQNALFVSVLNKQPAFTTPAQIDELIAYAKKAKINVLFVQLYRANLAWFPSKMADDSPYRKIVKEIGQDPVALLIKKAHENGIEIHAWVNLLSLSQNKDAKILKKYGLSILTRNLEPKQGIEDYKIDNQYFLEPSDSRVRYELAGMVEEILTTYRNIDGIQFDYIRYPDVHPSYGYSPIILSDSKKRLGKNLMRKISNGGNGSARR